MTRLALTLLLLALCGCRFVCDTSQCYAWGKPVDCEVSNVN